MPVSNEWLIFLGTATVFAFTPGPAMMYVLARSVHDGRRVGIESALGNAIGTLAHVLAAAVGLSTLLATSPVAFAALTYAGAAYLVVLGVQALRTCRGAEQALTGGTASAPSGFAGSPLVQGIMVETLNPKTALYFMALLPHFVHPDRAAPAAVLSMLGLVVVVVALTADVIVALAASRFRVRLATNVRWQVGQRAGSGLVLIGLGTFVAVA